MRGKHYSVKDNLDLANCPVTKAFELHVQSAILLTLLDSKALSQWQYEESMRQLEKSYQDEQSVQT